MLEAIKNFFRPKRTFEFMLICPATGEKINSTIVARSEYEAAVNARMSVDTGRWIVCPMKQIK